MNSDTRTRLLIVAAEVFAEQGYRHAKVRDICTRANANIAAINYHYRDKEQLYMAVIEYILELVQKKASHLTVDPTLPAEERLNSFIHSFLNSVFCNGAPAWHGKLVINEMIDPTPALDLVVERLARPVNEIMTSIVEEMLGPDIDKATVELCVASVISQCVTYHTSREIMIRLNPTRQLNAEVAKKIADHVTFFSLAGLHAMAEKIRKEKEMADA